MAQIRLAFIGCGGNSGGHARRMRDKEEVDIVGCCDVSTEIAQAYIDKHLAETRHQPKAYDDIQTMLDELRPDAVVISTPHTLHFQQGMMALEAGCHVLMEKPMVTSAEHARILAAKVEETGKVFTIGYNTSCTPAFGWLRDRIRENAFGRLELVTGYITQNWMKGTAGKWRQDPALSGGGQAYDSGAHLLNSLCWSVESDIAEVFAFVDNHGTAVDINSVINVRFANNVLASITVSGNCAARPGTHMGFIFENGRVEIDGWSGGWVRAWDGPDEVEIELDDEKTTPDDNFIDVILGRAAPRTSPRNGIIHSDLMDAIYESQRTGLPVKPARE